MLDLLVTAVSAPSLKGCGFKQQVASLPEVLVHQITEQQSSPGEVYFGVGGNADGTDTTLMKYETGARTYSYLSHKNPRHKDHL